MLALSSRRVVDDRARLAPVAAVAKALGFRQAFASAPPADSAAAKEVFAKVGISVVAVGANAADGPATLTREVGKAAEAAAALGIRLVVADAWPLPADATEAAREIAAQSLARTIHGILSGREGLSLALRVATDAEGLLGFREAEWLLGDLSHTAIGLWLEPARVESGARAGRGVRTLDWADRFGARILGVTIAPPETGGGLGRPEDSGVDWGTLRESVPSRAARVVDVGPKASDAEVFDLRRRFEEVLGW